MLTIDIVMLTIDIVMLTIDIVMITIDIVMLTIDIVMLTIDCLDLAPFAFWLCCDFITRCYVKFSPFSPQVHDRSAVERSACGRSRPRRELSGQAG